MTDSHDLNPDVPNVPLATDVILQGRYRIVRQLGRGGMGAVYEAEDQRLGITVALKETLSSEPSMRRQFEHEARLLAGMQHPALPRVSDHFVEGNRAFLVMQFIGGIDLARIISQQPGPFPRDQVIAWADQILDALVYLHSRDREVIHRDIKPHNLKVTSNGQIALLDFGLAKAQHSDPSVTSSQAFFGYTRHYAPLEQIQDQRTDPRSDIYALGATLYHLLTGTKPPDAMVRASALVSGNPDPLRPANEVHSAVGQQISAILMKAMAQRPGERYASANDFREAFRRMGRTGNLAAVINSEVDRGVVPESLRPVAQQHPIGENGTVVKSAVVELAMVESARRFGPAGMTAVLVLLVVLTGGIFYGSQRWFGTSAQTKAIADPSATDASPRQSTLPRKVERAKAADNPRAVETARPTETETAATVRSTNVKDEESGVREAVKKEAARTDLGLTSRRTKDEQRRTSINQRKVDPPSIRLPDPEFRENAPARPRAHRISSVKPLDGPKFYRSPDGTQIVTFPDGSTQYVRPLPRSARAGR